MTPRSPEKSGNSSLSKNVMSVIRFSPTNKSFKKSINNSLWMACPKMRLKPTSVKGLMNLAIFLAFDSNQGKVTKKN